MCQFSDLWSLVKGLYLKCQPWSLAWTICWPFLSCSATKCFDFFRCSPLQKLQEANHWLTGSFGLLVETLNQWNRSPIWWFVSSTYVHVFVCERAHFILGTKWSANPFFAAPRIKGIKILWPLSSTNICSDRQNGSLQANSPKASCKRKPNDYIQKKRSEIECVYVLCSKRLAESSDE